MELLPRREWIDYSHRVIHHGRRVCKARTPLCEQCSLVGICQTRGGGSDAEQEVTRVRFPVDCFHKRDDHDSFR